MDGLFYPQLLDLTRLLVLQGERVANPDFYPMLRSFGLNNLPTNLRWQQLVSAMWLFLMSLLLMDCSFTNSFT